MLLVQAPGDFTRVADAEGASAVAISAAANGYMACEDDRCKRSRAGRIVVSR